MGYELTNSQPKTSSNSNEWWAKHSL